MKIRKFKPKDYKELVKVLKSGYVFHKDIDNYKVGLRVYKNDPDLSLVAEEDKKIVGAVLGQGDGRIGFIWGLAVLPKYQGKGIGKKLMLEIEKRLMKRKCVGISLLTEPNRKKAIEMYKKIGYKNLRNFYLMVKGKLR